MYEQLDEPVETFVQFKNGKTIPRSFTWRGKKHEIEKVGLLYERQNGRVNRHYFSVLSGGALYKLYFDTERLLWVLEEVYVE